MARLRDLGLRLGSPAAFDEVIENWLHCKEEDEACRLDDGHFDRQFATETPGPMLIGAAQAPHHACRIKAKIVHTREAQDAYDQYMVKQVTGKTLGLLSCVAGGP